MTTRGEGSAGAKTGPSGARTPPVASRQSTGSTEHMHSDLLEEAAGREGLPGRGLQVGKIWGSGEGVGGGLNFTLSDLQGPGRETLKECVKNWNFGLPGRGSEVGNFCSEYVQGPPDYVILNRLLLGLTIRSATSDIIRCRCHTEGQRTTTHLTRDSRRGGATGKGRRARSVCPRDGRPCGSWQEHTP